MREGVQYGIVAAIGRHPEHRTERIAATTIARAGKKPVIAPNQRSSRREAIASAGSEEVTHDGITGAVCVQFENRAEAAAIRCAIQCSIRALDEPLRGVWR